MKIEPAIYSTIQFSMGGVLALLGAVLLIQFQVALQHNTEVPVSLLTALVALLLLKDGIAMLMSAILSGVE